MTRFVRVAIAALAVTLPSSRAGAQRPDSLRQRPDSALRMPAIVVTATRSEQMPAGESPVAASVDTVVGADRAEGRIAVDLLRNATGVHVQQTSAGQGAVVLRGLVGNQVLYLVDGIPLNNGTYRDGPGQYLATIDPESIDRFEIIRGPASVLYGSDAQGGAVNVITRPHPVGLGWSLGATGEARSANMGGRVHLSSGYGTSTLRLGIGATLADAGDLRAGGAVGTQRPTGFTTAGVDARLEWTPSRRHRLTLAAQHFAMDDVPRYDRYVDFRAPAPGPDARYEFDPQTRQLAYARYAWHAGTPLLQVLTTTASLAVQREGFLRQRLRNGAPEAATTYTRDDVFTPGLSLVGESRIVAGVRAIALTWGAEIYHDRLYSYSEMTNLVTGAVTPVVRQTAIGLIATGKFPTGATMDRTGAFLEISTLVVPRLRVSAGGRWSGFRTEAEVGTEFGGAVANTASALTGQGGLVLSVTESVDAVARVAQGFRAPNLYDLTNIGAVPGGVVIPNPDAQPERSLSYEAGLRVHTRRTAAAITAYRTLIHDFIDRAPATFHGDTLLDGERVFQGRNIGEARLWGIEAEALHAVGQIEGRATLLYTYGQQTLGDGTREPMSKIPPLAGTLRLRWLGLAGRWWAGYQLAWADRQDRLSSRDLTDTRIEPDGTPGYAVHSLLASVAVTPVLSASLGFENLANTLYRTHASGVDAPGRNVWVGVRFLQ